MKPAFMKSKTYLKIQPTKRNRQIEVTTNFTCLRNNPLKLPFQRTAHKTEHSRNLESADQGFHVLISGFCITLELSGSVMARKVWHKMSAANAKLFGTSRCPLEQLVVCNVSLPSPCP